MRILSGIQPSGVPHIGNYFGMMRPAVELQKQGEAFLFIADYHALTTNPDPKELRERVLGVALDFLACGLDPEKTVFFRQSDVPQVTELTWILNTVTTVGLLERAHSYKDKIAKGFVPNNGLFSYPVLMASDILIYHSNIVPVGKDQKQHVEITRDIAIRFNNIYGDVFTIPQEKIREDVAIVPGLDGQKMSKSYNNIIPVFAEPDQIRKLTSRIKTDSSKVEDPKDPDKCIIYNMYKFFASKEDTASLRKRYLQGGLSWKEAKDLLADELIKNFEEPRRRYDEILKDKAGIRNILLKNSEHARAICGPVMKRVRDAIGILS